MRLSLVAAAVVPVVVLTATPASAAIAVADLGSLPGHPYSQATSVRDDGVAVGESHSPDGSRAVVFADGSVTSLATPGRNSAADDINSAGVIVGEAEPAGIERPFPVWWDGDGVLHELSGSFEGGRAYGVNDDGVVVGIAEGQGLSAVRWPSVSSPAVQLAPLPGGENYAGALDVNASGVAVGFPWRLMGLTTLFGGTRLGLSHGSTTWLVTRPAAPTTSTTLVWLSAVVRGLAGRLRFIGTAMGRRSHFLGSVGHTRRPRGSVTLASLSGSLRTRLEARTLFDGVLLAA